MIVEDAHEHAVEEENYFVSMTDMMVGLIFVFLIMLMYYALQFQSEKTRLDSSKTRLQALQDIERVIETKLQIDVYVDEDAGVLRLPQELLFATGQASLSGEGQSSAAALSDALAAVLPCYASRGGDRSTCRPGLPEHYVESAYIEGHTDDEPAAGVGCLEDNLALSACRSVATFRAVVSRNRELASVCTERNGQCSPVLSVSGYGENRPVPGLESAADKAANRRIDLRLIMLAPERAKPEQALDEVAQRQQARS